ncbi:MAG: hypothetical protein KDD33_13625 [Bdellovibrionales bacterium]|nr:hypothetical protein [Bdellovibrionales bacterium]
MKAKWILIALLIPFIASAETTTQTGGDDSDVHGYESTSRQMLQTCIDSTGPLHSHDANPLLMVAREMVLLGKQRTFEQLFQDYQSINKRVRNESLKTGKTNFFFDQATEYELKAAQAFYSLRGLIRNAALNKTLQNKTVGLMNESQKAAKAFYYEFTNQFKSYETVIRPQYDEYESMRKKRNRIFCERYKSIFDQAAEATVAGDDNYFNHQQKMILGMNKICGLTTNLKGHPMCPE